LRASLPFAIAASLVIAAPAARAASIVHDSVAGFATLAFTPGGPVAAARRDAGAMFDGANGTIRSLGTGGTLTAGIAAGQRITQVTFTELTLGVLSGHVEQAFLALAYDGDNDGVADGAWTEIGTLRNDEWTNPSLPAVSQAAPGTIASLSGVFAGDLTTFSLKVNSGDFNLLRLVDASPAAAGRDGFDIAEFRVTSVGTPDAGNPIPAPAGLGLFAFGLAGLAIARRRSAGR
jgi:hypothetical protein